MAIVGFGVVGIDCLCMQVYRKVSKQASKQASKHASKQASMQVSGSSQVHRLIGLAQDMKC